MNRRCRRRSALLFISLICVVPSIARADERPNIVWIFVEDMNGWMGCYGDDTVPTPNIDALAERGTRFDRCYMPAGVCSATRSAIALGAMQTSLGVHNHRSSRRRVPGEVISLPDGVKTVYQVLRENGYYVASTGGKNDFNFMWRMEDLYDHGGKRIGFTGPIWEGRKKGQPFFAQIQLRGGKNSGRFKGRTATGKKSTDTDPAKMEVPPYYPDHPIIRRELAHHYDCIRQTDDEVGEIIAALKKDDLLESTIVFFWTDHGMRLPRHKQWLYEGGIRVPLVVAGPGIPKGKVRDDLVSGIDITATSLALADIKPPKYMEGRDFFAKNYKPREYVVSARDRCDYTIERVRAVTTKRYKYLRNFLTDRPFMQPQYRDGRDYVEIGRRLHKEGKLTPAQAFMWSKKRVPEELYDLENDPHEINNLANDPKHAEALEKHRKLLANWVKETDDKGQYPESAESLRGVLKRWSKQAVNPEYEKARKE
ncbi:MAG: sulfatase [Pirellulales bacterium]|nr:sulfatase [Pirellulales bacterium]